MPPRHLRIGPGDQRDAQNRLTLDRWQQLPSRRAFLDTRLDVAGSSGFSVSKPVFKIKVSELDGLTVSDTTPHPSR